MICAKCGKILTQTGTQHCEDCVEPVQEEIPVRQVNRSTNCDVQTQEECQEMKQLKIFWIFYGVLAIILITATVIAYNVNYSYKYKGNHLKLVTADRSGVIMTDKNDGTLVMTVESSKSTLNCTIQYLNETLRYETSRYSDNNSTYTFSDGSRLTNSPRGMIITNLNTYNDSAPIELSDIQASEKLLIAELLHYYKSETSIFMHIVFTIIGLLVLLFGLGCLFYPVSIWRYATFLIVSGGEPTGFAIFGIIILGIISVMSPFVFLCGTPLVR
jgi:hypothetical protein